MACRQLLMYCCLLLCTFVVAVTFQVSGGPGTQSNLTYLRNVTVVNTTHPPTLETSLRLANQPDVAVAPKNFVTIPLSHALPLTVSVWVKSSLEHADVLFRLRDPATGETGVLVVLNALDGGWVSAFARRSDGSTVTVSDNRAYPNVWCFVTLTIAWDGVMVLMVVGGPESYVPRTHSPPVPGLSRFTALHIGSGDATWGTFTPFTGYISDLRVYSAAVSYEFVRGLYHAVATPQSSACPEDPGFAYKWVYYADDGTEGHDSCFFFSPYAWEVAVWEDARTLSCEVEAAGAHLLTLSTTSKESAVMNLIAMNVAWPGSNGVFYVGCSQQAPENTGTTEGWSWVDSSPASTLNCGLPGNANMKGCNLWGSGEPNDWDGPENCCALSNWDGTLMDVGCGSGMPDPPTFRFVCELDLSPNCM